MRTVLAALMGLVVAGVIGIIGWTVGEQSEHRNLAGHPVVIERVNSLQADVAIIKSDVKLLLRRLNRVGDE